MAFPMDSLTHFLAITGLLALLLHFYFPRTKHNTEKNKTITAPEPSGSLPLIGHLHLLGGEVPIFRILGAMADKYGPVFSLRLGPRRALVVSSWEAVKDCFTTNDMVFVTRPILTLSKYLGYEQAMFAIAPYGPYWRDVRKIVTLELMTNHRLEKLRHVRESEVDLCIHDLHLLCMKNGNLPTQVTMNEWVDHLTFNVIVRMLAGKRFSGSTSPSNSDEEGHKIKQGIKKALYLSGLFVVSDNIPWLECFDFGGYVKAMKQTSKEVDEVLSSWLEEHIQKKNKRMELVEGGGGGGEADFIDVLLSILGEDTIICGHKRDTVIKSTVMILIMTGSESTADTLTWALSLLLNNRQALKTAQAELDAQVGRHRWVQESDISSLKYLQAIVKETLRLYPPGPASGPREAMEDCQVGGYRVKKGTRLIVNLWKLQRDKRVWSDPDEFQPERFLNDHVNVGYKGQNFEYVPFSSGRRMCPGLTFGLQVVHLALAKLIHGFNLGTPAEAAVDMTEGLGLALPKEKPLEVVLTPRLPMELYQS